MEFKKIKLILGVLFVFFLILGTNLIDRNNFKKIQSSIETIYEDRLVAQGIIYKMAGYIQQKDMALAISDSSFYLQKNQAINSALNQLIIDYQLTKLTEEEEEVFVDLQRDITALFADEKESAQNLQGNSSKVEKDLNGIKNELQILAEIQLKEGRLVLDDSKKAMRTIELFTQIEIYGLVALAIIFQLLIIGGIRRRKAD